MLCGVDSVSVHGRTDAINFVYMGRCESSLAVEVGRRNVHAACVGR